MADAATHQRILKRLARGGGVFPLLSFDSDLECIDEISCDPVDEAKTEAESDDPDL